MGYKVYTSDATITTNAGFGSVAHLPCIFDARPGYHRLGSRYLIDRGLGVWNPQDRLEAKGHFRPTKQTILNYANWLANFLEWTDTRCIDLQTCTYSDHIYGRYQTEMLDGTWSRDASALSASTVNVRVQQACDFLSWMSDKGFRPSFQYATEVTTVRTRSSPTSARQKTKQVTVRKGKVRKDKKHLRMPTDYALRTWLDAVYQKSGLALGLMCETVLLSAVRLEEAACWRVDTLPLDKAEWHINNPTAPYSQQQVRISIRFGTKGPAYGYDHGDKIGPEGSILIPIHLADRLDAYRKKDRNPALRKWVKSAPASQQKERVKTAVHLFRDERTGERITGRQLYRSWTSVELPFPGWSPHLGRDWWSCSILWRELKKHEHLMSSGVNHNTATALIESTAQSIIRLQIQPQLRHADESTSMIYLQWAIDMLSVGLSVQYDDEHNEKYKIAL